jgi:hypothetical protein
MLQWVLMQSFPVTSMVTLVTVTLYERFQSGGVVRVLGNYLASGIVIMLPAPRGHTDEETHMARLSMETRPAQDIAVSPHKGSNWPSRTSCILGLLAIAAVPIFFLAALSAGFDEIPLEVPTFIVIGTVAVGIVAIATGIAGLLWSKTHAARNQPKGLAIAGIVLGAIAIVVNLVSGIVFSALYVAAIFVPR